MRRTYSVGKRVIALLLSLVLILSLVPGTGLIRAVSADSVDSGVISSVADGNTMDSWKIAFAPANISTEHAGGVWTDKSVFTKDDALSANGALAGLGITADDDNFLVALSALAANSVIVGQGTMPTDTIFVLDISGSMNTTELDAMVNAANDAIHTLLSGNEKNRVGVVLYSTRASVLLEVDRYTPVTMGQDTESTADDEVKYIELTSNYIRTARLTERVWVENNWGHGGHWETTVTDILKDGQGNQVDTSVSLTGGTYIQGGLYTAWEQFNAVSITDNRTPVLVLMSDGAPTFNSNDYNNVPNNYEEGTGNDSYDGDGFLSQLTAAYVKEKMADKYSNESFTATPYFYTLGLGVESDYEGFGNNRVEVTSVAQAVLDTSLEREGIEEYWKTFLALADAEDKTMSVTVGNAGSGGNTTDVTVTYDATVTAASQEYVDKYFPASSASDLSAAFKGIVNEISLRAGYYVTRLDGTGANSGGYVTFVDEIGTGMEVKQIEGILIGDTLYTGKQLAQAMENGDFGTVESPTSLGDNLVWAVVERLRITDSQTQTAVEIARELLGKAYAAGQIGYDSETGEWSNYIAWFGDANGKYIGFWDAADPDAAIPAGAVYANMCYGMLGATTDSQTTHASDMMYVAIQVSKKVTEDAETGALSLEAKTPQTVTFRIPAALLPTVTYQISVDVGSNGEISEDAKATIAYKAAEPIRLIYEVGVHSELTPENISQFVRKGYQTKDEKGNYYLYTNAWNWEGADDQNWKDESIHPQKGDAVLQDTGKNAISYAYFEPGEDNEHYYFTEDAPVYVKNAAGAYVPYEGDTQPNGTYYFRHLTYTASADSSDPAKEVPAAITAHFEELSAAALLQTEQTEGAKTWYVPEGTMHRNTHYHDSDKTVNTTGSFFAVRHQLVDSKVNGDSSHHYEIIYMGNNGRITYAPAQGFTLTKAMAEGEDAQGQSFSFTVTVTGDTDGKVTVTRDGVSAEMTLTDSKLQLTLAAGETVQVTGMDIGAAYTIQENELDGYKLSGIAARNDADVDNAAATVSDTVLSNVIHAVTYTNAIQNYGSLLVSKAVTYLKNSQPAGANTQTFQVKVTLNGLGGKTVYVDGSAVTLASDGTHTFDITDGKSVLITGIPEDTAYTVEEVTTGLPKGYTAITDSVTGTIDADATDTAALKNQYEPEDVVFDNEEPKITVQVNKTLAGETMTDWSFEFELLYYNGKAWEPVTVNNEPIKLTATNASPSATFDLAGVALTSVGEHYFRIAEVIPTQQIVGMTYDRTFHDFKVIVVDDLSGQLKIDQVESVQHAQVGEPTDANGDGEKELWTVTTGFTNTFSADSTKLTIQANKLLYNITTGTEENMALKDGQFQFTLYTADQNFENLVKVEDSRNGVTGQVIFAPITYEFSKNGVENTYYYVVKETSTSGNGYTVDGTQYQIAVTVKQQDTGNGTSVLQITQATVKKNDEEPVDVTQTVIDNSNVLNGSTITFKNTYAATHAEATIEGSKTLTNETPGVTDKTMTVPTGAFSFKLTALDGAPMPEGITTGSQIVSNSGSAFVFGKIVYTKAGTYHYTITEEAPTAAGMHKDTTVHNVTVEVTDDGAGKLEASVLYNGSAENTAAFHNTYKAEAVTGIVLSGTKDLQTFVGSIRTLKAGDFRFTLTKPDGTTETVANDAQGKFAFSELSFDTVGEYQYSIAEVGAGTTVNGVSYDSKTIQVTVKVIDGGNGKLVAMVGDDVITNYNVGEFENTYTAAPVKVQLTAHKYLSGDRDLKEKEFSFTLTKPNASDETVFNGADGQVKFEEITYYSVGEHVYKIVENKLDENGDPLTPNEDGLYVYKGVTYSQMEYTVTVKITDNGTGALVAQVTSVDGHGNELPVQFFNRYEPKSVTVNLTGENDKDGGKILDDKTSGTDKKDLTDFEFKFVLTEEDGTVIETVSDNNVNGFNFADIIYNQAGEYVYYIYERNEGEEGISYDHARYKVTVKVTDNLVGELEAELSYEKLTVDANGNAISQPAQEITFTNTYEADPAGIWISGIKTLTNETPGVNDKIMAVTDGQFSFRLTALNGAPMAEGNTTDHEIVTNDADGNFAFSAIHFTKVGTYAYTVTEEDTSVPGVTKDQTEHTITVVVKDEGGQLVASITYDGDLVSGNAVEAEFHNIYKAAPIDTGIVLSGSKNIVGNWDLKEGDFKFTLTRPNAGSEAKPETVAIDENGNFQFSEQKYDTVGTYTYQITEENTKIPGFTYDKKVITVVVKVEDNGSGQLIAKVGDVQISGSYGVGEFKNIYEKPTVTVNLTGENNKDGIKTLDDKTSQTDKTLKDFEFKFVLTDAEGKEIETVTDNNGTGFNFADITFDQTGEYVYYISEKPGDVAGITYDTAKYQVTVKVTYNDALELVAAVTYQKITVGENGQPVTKDADEVVFNNTYEAKQTTVVLTGLKLLNNGRTQVPDEFKFTLTRPDRTTETVGNDKNGNFTFSELTFTAEGDYVCTIIEEDTKVPGVTYDNKTIEVKITVEDENGQLVAKVGDETINGSYNVGKFENSYAKSVTVNIEGSKANTEGKTLDDKTSLVDKTLDDFEFKFVLTDADGNVIETASDNGSGFAFEDITYTGPVQKVYYIYEKAENVAGISYDTAKYKVTVKVTDNIEKEELEAEVTYEKITTDESGKESAEATDAVIFTNTYKAKQTTVVLTGLKLLNNGRTQVPDEFKFTLTKPDGSPETVGNDENGNFTFSELTFTAEGDYVYTITEVDTKVPGVTYDKKTIEVKITVVDENGQLVAKVGNETINGSYNVGKFENSYAKSVTVNIEGSKANTEGKTLDDKTSLVDKTLNDFEFKFVLTDADGNVIETASDNGSGFAFEDITFTEPTQKVYFIYELDEDVPGVVYDTAKYKVIVKITDNIGKEELEAEVTYEKITTDDSDKEVYEKADGVTFANTYKAKETSISFAGIKTFDGGRKLKAGEFSFILKDAAGKEIETVQNDADGKFTFTAIPYTQEGKHVYTLEEVEGKDDKVKYDGTKYTLTVTVTDEDGTLKTSTEITVDKKPVDSYGFTNLFTPESAKATITVEKVLENKSDKVMGLNGFQFDLTCVETGKIISAISGTDGLAEIELSFSAADVGKTYNYKLTEQKGDVEGMTYSDAAYEIKVTVTQKVETGELVLDVTRDGTGNAKFINTYNKVTPPEEEIPKTGEETFVGNWAAMMSVSAICLLAVLVLGKKKYAKQ